MRSRQGATSMGKGGGAAAAGASTGAPAGARTGRTGSSSRASSSASASSGGGGGGGGSNMLRLYSDDADGLQIGPIPIVTFAVGFIMTVVVLHLLAKLFR